MKMLSQVINARMEEIVQQVYFEIRSSGYANKLIGGVVITGGGSQMKHLKQLVEYQTGLSARVGYPTEYLAKDTSDDLKNPMYATGIGLIIKGIEELEDLQRANNKLRREEKKEVVAEPVQEQGQVLEEEVRPIAQPTFQHPEMNTETATSRKTKKDSWIKGLLTNVKDWFEDDSVNKDFE